MAAHIEQFKQQLINEIDAFKETLLSPERYQGMVQAQYIIKKSIPASDPSTQEELWREALEKANFENRHSMDIKVLIQHFEIKRKNLKS